MKISQKQLLMLYDILIASLSIVNPLAFDQETRRKLAEDILNQQDTTIIKVGKAKKKPLST